MANVGIRSKNRIFYTKGNQRKRSIASSPEQIFLSCETKKTVIEQVAENATQPLFGKPVILDNTIIVIGVFIG